MAAASTTSTRRRASRRGSGSSKSSNAATMLVPSEGSRIWVLDEIAYGQNPPRGAKYNTQLKSYVVDAPELQPDVQPYRAKDYSLARWLEDELNVTPSPVSTVTPMTPRTDQLTDIAKVVRAEASGMRGFFLTSQTGTGKTLVSVRAARAIASRRSKGDRQGRILVLSNRPAALCIPDFRRTIQAAGGLDHRWLVTTVDRVHKAAALNIAWDVVIVDESHGYRSPDSRRSKARARITKATSSQHAKTPFVLDMTATPAHDPTELTYLGPLLAQRTGTLPKDWQGEDHQFANALADQGMHIGPGRYGMEWTGDPKERRQDIIWLRKVLEADPAVTAYRAAPWGPAPLDVAPIELDPARQMQYEADWNEYVDAMKLARKVGRGDQGRAAMLRWRQKALHLRVPDIAEWAHAQLEGGQQAVVYTDFVTTGAEPLVEALDALKVRSARLYGSRTDLAAELSAWAKGDAPVAVTTMTASINLHSGAVMPDGSVATQVPRIGAMAAPMYSGIKGRQVIGRTHRDHQVSPWVIMTAAGTVEEDIARTMIGRFAASDGIAGADTGALQKVAELLGASWLPLDDLDSAE